MRLSYFADPLCSWCYGFGPELSRLLERHGDMQLDLVMGGLRPYNTQAMTPAFRDMLRSHWGHVREASGLPFSEAILQRDDFVYDTEPPCRAVVSARTIDAAKAFGYFKAIQSAFYRDGRDMTRPGALADLAVESGYAFDEFVGALESEAMRSATRRDFEKSQSLGVSGFPTLALATGEQLLLVTSGFATDAVLDERLAEIARRMAAAST